MKNRHGMTLIELLISLAAATSTLLAVGWMLQQVRQRQKVAFDDLTSLAERRLVGQVLRKDLMRITPSFNALMVPADSEQVPFFEWNRASDCSEGQRECARTLTLDRGQSVHLLVDAGTAGGTLYDPALAFQGASYVGLNRENVVNEQAPSLPDRFVNGRLYLLRSLGESPVVMAGQDQCHCGAVRQACSASCSGARQVPYFRSSVYLGVASGIPASGKGGDLVKVQLTKGGFAGGLFADRHPSDSSLIFGSTPQSFLETLPPLGDMISRAELREVRLVRYDLGQEGDLVRREWTGSAGGTPAGSTLPGFEGSSLLVAKKVVRIVFRRPSLSIPLVSFQVEQEVSR